MAEARSSGFENINGAGGSWFLSGSSISANLYVFYFFSEIRFFEEEDARLNSF